MTEPDNPLDYRRVHPDDRRLARRRKLRTAVGAAVLIAVGGPTLFAIRMPSLGRSTSAANVVKCASNLRQISQACELFAGQNRGVYPATLQDILKTQDVSIELFCCPATDDYPAGTPEGWADAMGSYIYYGAGLRTGAPGDIIVARDRTFSNHAPSHSGVNVLFADGRAEFLTEPELIKATAKSATLRAEWEASRRSPPTSRPAG